MHLALVECNKKYWEFIRKLRTNPLTQNGFFSKVSITPEDQTKYMKENWEKYNVCLLDNIPVGYIGETSDGFFACCVSPKFQGKGIGTYIVKSFFSKHKNLKAKVKFDNISSQKMLEKSGFKKEKNEKNHICYTK